MLTEIPLKILEIEAKTVLVRGKAYFMSVTAEVLLAGKVGFDVSILDVSGVRKNYFMEKGCFLPNLKKFIYSIGTKDGLMLLLKFLERA